MSGLRLSLFTKIMIWFFLNLILLGLVFFLLIRIDFRFGKSTPFFAPGNRLELIARTITTETQDANSADRDAVINRLAAENRVGLYVFAEDGKQIGGPDLVLPDEVKSLLTPRMPMPARDNQGIPAGPMRPPSPSFFTRTSDPTRYWSSSPVFIFEQNGREPIRARLVASSSSVTGNGLFFNPTPWIVTIAGVVIISMLFWLPFVRRMTRDLARLDDATKRIADEDFTVRVDERRTDEIGHLGNSINHLAARLEGFVSGQKRFLGDISHELNSPLARMQFALGILEDHGDQKNIEYVRDVREEVELMTKLVGELLTYSKAGIRAQQAELADVVLAETVRGVVNRETAGTDTGVESLVDESIVVRAQPELLARAVGNVLRNAIRHAGSDGPIEISAVSEDGAVELLVSDSGKGVPPEALDRLFDPFFRVESHRSREDGGSGLGLAIVKTCVEACGGRVHAANRAPRGFEIKFILKKA